MITLTDNQCFGKNWLILAETGTKLCQTNYVFRSKVKRTFSKQNWQKVRKICDFGLKRMEILTTTIEKLNNYSIFYVNW